MTASDTEPVPEHLAPLGPWLEARIPDAEAVELLGMRKASSGFSADTVMIDVAVTRGGIANDERYVLRTESPEPAIYPVQIPGWQIEIELQYRIMDAVGRHSDVPIAPMIGFEHDGSVLGTPFFVMGYIGGQVPVENPPYTTEGFFLDVAPADRTRMIERGLGTLARVHALDWRAAGLDWLVPAGATPGLDTQLSLWEAYYRAELRDRVHPLADRAFAWLHAERPRASDVGLCWGDPRPGNIMRAVLGRRLESLSVQIVFTAHLASVLRTMAALDGRGIAWLPQTLVEDDLGQGRLVAAASSDWAVPLEIRLYRDSELLGKAANALWNTAVGG